MELKKTPLYEVHRRSGGRIIDFAGWALPVWFSSIIEEHRAVRNDAGLFDVSDMGELEILGVQAVDLLQKAVTNDVFKMDVGRVMYSPVCNPAGGVVDDVLLYELERNRFMVVINAANIEKDYDWVRRLAGDFPRAEVRNISAEVAEVALQGPRSVAILRRLTSIDPGTIGYYRCAQGVDVGGILCSVVSRTGYTGEDGFELYCTPADAPALWEAIMDAGKGHGLVPGGLGCRDTLRFEAAMPLYGQELDDETTPLEAGLDRFVSLAKGEFVGREALLAQAQSGVRRRLVGFEMVDRGIPRTGYPVLKDGERVGHVTTGSYSPTLNRSMGLGYVRAEHAREGTVIAVAIRGKEAAGRVVKTPFYRRRKE